MADFAVPAQMSQFARGLSRADYMASWAGYTTDPRFAYRADAPRRGARGGGPVGGSAR